MDHRPWEDCSSNRTIIRFFRVMRRYRSIRIRRVFASYLDHALRNRCCWSIWNCVPCCARCLSGWSSRLLLRQMFRAPLFSDSARRAAWKPPNKSDKSNSKIWPMGHIFGSICTSNSKPSTCHSRPIRVPARKIFCLRYYCLSILVWGSVNYCFSHRPLVLGSFYFLN